VSGTTIADEGDNLGVGKAVFEVADSLVKLKAFNAASDVVAVLVMRPQVSNSAFSG